MFNYNFCDNAYLWEYFTKTKKISLKSSCYLEQQIYRWQYKVRYLWKRGLLSVENIDVLNQVEGWKWICYNIKPIKITFEENVNLWRNFYKMNGRYPLYKNPQERKILNWQTYTRKRYKDGKLTQKQILLLNSVEGWKWNK